MPDKMAGVVLTSQRDASYAQAMKAQAGFLEASLDYLLTRDELTRTLGRTTPYSCSEAQPGSNGPFNSSHLFPRLPLLLDVSDEFCHHQA
jgi:hypothetical protein